MKTLADHAQELKTRRIAKTRIAKHGVSGLFADGRKYAMENEKRLMKAWLVREKDEFCATVVFAETRGKARALAMHTETCEDADFCDIDVYREPTLDKYYVDGKKEMSWFIAKDRIALVKDGGFVCDPDYWEEEDCENCPARDYCYKWQDRIREREEQSWL